MKRKRTLVEIIAPPTQGEPSSLDTLADLGKRLGQGDRAAYAEIFRRLHGPLIRYARRITHDDAVAYDVLQDVFMKLWEDRMTLTVKVSLKAMLYTMVRNRAFNSLRRNKWMATEMAVEDMQDLYETAPHRDETLDAERLQQRIARWIDELPTRRGEAFILSRYHGLRHSEIAALMGLSERTVDTHILHALRDLRGRLDQLQSEGMKS